MTKTTGGRIKTEDNFGVIIFLSAGLLIIPQLFYITNANEFSHDLILLTIPIVTAIVAFILSTFVKIHQKLQYLLAGFGISIFLCDQTTRLDINHLDGSSSIISTSPLSSSLNALLYFGLPIFFYFYGEKFKKKLIDLSYILILLTASLAFYSLSLSLLSPANNSEEQVLANKASTQENPNIYFVWLDAMEMGYMKKYLSEPGNNTAFSGFTFFINNSSNYLYTMQSYASFMSGTVFKGGNYEEWSENRDDLRDSLSKTGYKITTYAKRDFLSSKDEVTYSSDTLFLKWTNLDHPYISDFVTYWIVRSAPHFLANNFLKAGNYLGGLIHSWLNIDTPHDKVKSISDGIEPLSGVFTLKQFILDEKARRSNNEFVIAQALIPHAPYVIDEKCNYRGVSKDSPSLNYYKQVECVGGLVTEFINELKRLERFDSSLIILMGDHGAGWAGLVDRSDNDKAPLNKQYMSWSKSKILSRTSALLMIKPPTTNSDRNLIFSDRESQLVDIYPTILNLIDHTMPISNDIVGVNLFGKAHPDREKYITYFKPSRAIDTNDAQIYDLIYSPGNGLTDVVYRSNLIEDSVLPAISCNQTISFSSGTQDINYYRAAGLSGAESWGTWSDDKTVTLKLRTPNNPCPDLSIVFQLRAFFGKSKARQQAKVFLNDSLIGDVVLNINDKIPREFSFTFPSDLQKQGEINTVTFEISDPASPKSVGLNTDTRLLGLGFESMVFH